MMENFSFPNLDYLRLSLKRQGNLPLVGSHSVMARDMGSVSILELKKYIYSKFSNIDYLFSCVITALRATQFW